MTVNRKRALLVALLLTAGLTFWLSCGGDNSSEPCYTLTVETVGYGSIAVSPEASCYQNGTVVTLTATPGESWLFDNWSGNIDLGGAENDEAIEITVGAANISLTATFAQGYSLTFYSEPENSGTVDAVPDQAYYTEGTMVTLTSSAAAGYIFASWSVFGDNAIYTDDPFELTTGASNMMVTAIFNSFEGEPDCGTDYIDDYNGGCNSDPNVFLPIENGEVYTGTSGTYLVGGSTYRDTDWYEYVATGNEVLIFSAVAEFPVQLLIIDGTGGCGSFTILTNDSGNVGDTVVVSYIVPAGTYWMWVGPSVFDTWDCPYGYVAWLDAHATLVSEMPERVAIDERLVSDQEY